jgi:hypothetical protein
MKVHSVKPESWYVSFLYKFNMYWKRKNTAYHQQKKMIETVGILDESQLVERHPGGK